MRASVTGSCKPKSSMLPYGNEMAVHGPRDPWPAWGRHLAVAFTNKLEDDEEDYRDYLRGTQPPPFGPTVVIRRRKRWLSLL